VVVVAGGVGELGDEQATASARHTNSPGKANEVTAPFFPGK
jgi:hypothetical protein